MTIEQKGIRYRFDYNGNRSSMHPREDLDDEKSKILREIYDSKDTLKIESNFLYKFAQKFLAKSIRLSEFKELRIRKIDAEIDGAKYNILKENYQKAMLWGNHGEKIKLPAKIGQEVKLIFTIESRRCIYYSNQVKELGVRPESLVSVIVTDEYIAPASIDYLLKEHKERWVKANSHGIAVFSLGTLKNIRVKNFVVVLTRENKDLEEFDKVEGRIFIRSGQPVEEMLDRDKVYIGAPPVKPEYEEIRQVVFSDIVSSYDPDYGNFRFNEHHFGINHSSGLSLYDTIVLSHALKGTQNELIRKYLTEFYSFSSDIFFRVEENPLLKQYDNPKLRVQEIVDGYTNEKPGWWRREDAMNCLSLLRFAELNKDDYYIKTAQKMLERLYTDIQKSEEPVGTEGSGKAAREVFGSKIHFIPHGWVCLALIKGYDILRNPTYLNLARKQLGHIIKEHMDWIQIKPIPITTGYQGFDYSIYGLMLFGVSFKKLCEIKRNPEWQNLYGKIRKRMFDYISQREKDSLVDKDGTTKEYYYDYLSLTDRIMILHFFMPEFYPYWNKN